MTFFTQTDELLVRPRDPFGDFGPVYNVQKPKMINRAICTTESKIELGLMLTEN